MSQKPPLPIPRLPSERFPDPDDRLPHPLPTALDGDSTPLPDSNTGHT